MTRWYSTSPSGPPSRPRPDCFTPPNGAATHGDHATVDAHHARLEPGSHPAGAVQVAGDQERSQTVLGVVGPGYGLRFGVEPEDGGDGAKISSAVMAASHGTWSSTIGPK